MVELSTTSALHTNRLYYRRPEDRSRWAHAYDVRFPQYFYYFEDNHRGERQTTIGLLLDEDGIAPLVPAAMPHLPASSNLGGSLPDRIEDFVFHEQDRAKPMFVTLRAPAGVPEGWPLSSARSHFSTRIYRHQSDTNGIAIYDVIRADKRDVTGARRGFVLENPETEFGCLAGAKYCEGSFPIRNSKVTFTFLPERLPQLGDMASAVKRVIQSHLIGDSRS